jgi:hypothetical protein
MNTHGVLIPYGRYKGQLFTRIPVGYLKWMVNTRQNMWETAQAEFKRRGSKMPTIELSGHAIDNASIRVRKIWHDTKLDDNEGIYSWLMRMTEEALKDGDILESGKIKYKGMKFVVEQGEEFPVLKTIMR